MEDIVFGENGKTTPNRVIVLDDPMTEAFGVQDNESTMNLLMMKLSHHNNISVLIVCHELYPKGKSSMLFRDQLTGVHLHSIANQQKVKKYVYSYLSDDRENNTMTNCDSLKGNRHGSIFIKFTPSPYQDSTAGRR